MKDSAVETEEIEIHAQYRAACRLGILQIDQVKISSSPPALKEQIALFCSSRKKQFAGREIFGIPGVADARALFQALGLNPSKTRPCSETFLRHILARGPFPPISNLVDLNNYCSAEAATPVCVYDRGALALPVQLRPGKEGESYESIRGSRIDVSGRPVLADQTGPFGSPFVDSARTRITESTIQALVVWFVPACYPHWMLKADLRTYATRLMAHHIGMPTESSCTIL